MLAGRRIFDRGMGALALALLLAIPASGRGPADTQPPPPAASRDGQSGARPISDTTLEHVWQSQPALVTQAVGALQPAIAGHANVYAIALAGQGSQRLFSREARLALQVAAARYGADYRGGVLLSNVYTDMSQAPLATQRNFTQSAAGIGRAVDPARDLAFIYLVSHGAPEAELATSLANMDELPRISAASVARALAASTIKRRVIIISACFSASWIPALQNDDTIIITAAAANRTSFGCDDSRELTFFGEAFLKGPLARGGSLREAFEAARAAVAGWEAAGHLTPSDPQAFIGRNMTALWTARAAASAAP